MTHLCIVRSCKLTPLPPVFFALLFYSVMIFAQHHHHERTLAYFNGSSHLIIDDNFDSFHRRAGLSFKTCENNLNGTILHQVSNNNDSVSVQVINRELTVVFNPHLGNRSVIFSSDENFISGWINVDFYLQPTSREGPKLQVTIGKEEISLANLAVHSELLDMYLAGHKKFSIGSNPDGSNGFVGCIMAGPQLPLSENVTNEANVLWNVCPLDNYVGCEKVKMCSSHPCLNGGVCVEGNSSYHCACPLRFNGTNCEVDNGPLCNVTSKPCFNGTCKEIAGGNDTVCQCRNGFYGNQCENEGFNPCENSPCQNRAICESLSTANYTCWCQEGYTGRTCETVIDHCESEQCHNGGLCRSLVNDFECLCNGTGYQGRHCNDDVNECLSNPCGNNSTCFNRPGDYVCLCGQGYQGKYCNEKVDYCISLPCQNDGVCRNADSSYECECVIGFTGKNCQDEVDRCEGNSCNPYNEICVSKLYTYICVCREGFGESNCTNIDECASSPCQNNATCLDAINAFRCDCIPGYTGVLCEEDINECEVNPCGNEARCEDLVNGYNCLCTLGWTGVNCSQEFRPCDSNPCKNNATCSTLLDSESPGYSCDCQVGFDGYHCEANINDCYLVQCDFNEVCVDHTGFYSCECNAGYKRDELGNCTVEVNECEPSPCQNGAECIDRLNSYECYCTYGYTGINCEHQINYCESSPCQNGGFCKASFGKYNCLCQNGFVGLHCEFFYDSCLSNPCINGECKRTSSGVYECVCEPGYTGQNCEIDINECSSNPCLNGKCNDMVAQFNCTCDPGWRGVFCEEDINECLSDPCQNKGNCSDKIASYECFCPPGYAGQHCEVDVDECESSPCLHNGTCHDEIAKFSCYCNGTGYTGDSCETEIDECDVYDPCHNGAVCVDKLNDYECDCLPGFIGEHCEHKDIKPQAMKVDINECLSQPCLNNATCLEKSNQTLYPSYFGKNFTFDRAEGYACDCLPGYEGERCQFEIDECTRWVPCRNNGSCYDLINDYHCECARNGYAGRNCTVALVGCDRGHNCLHNSTCVPYLQDEELDLHSYTCSCTSGFTGDFCQLPTTGSFSESSLAIFNPQSSPQPSHVLSFSFRTTLLDSHLVSVKLKERSEPVKISLSGGSIHLQSGNGNQTGAGAFNNGAWHQLMVQINASMVSLQADDPDNASYPHLIAQQSQELSAITIANITFGKIDDAKASYSGCIKDLTLNDNVFALEDAEILIDVEEQCMKKVVCTVNTCSHRGVCEDLWDKARCHCERPYIGVDCTWIMRPATFSYKNTTSFAVFKIPHMHRTEFNISMFILTREASGLLVHAGGLGGNSSVDDVTYSQIRLQLQLGKLQVAFDEDGLYNYDVILDDGRYHFIDVKIKESDITVVVDDESFSKKELLYPINISLNDIYLGGFPPKGERIRRATSSEHFKGAIQDVRLNGNRLIFDANDTSGISEDDILLSILPTRAESLLKGEVSDPLCPLNQSSPSNPCQNGGYCNLTFNDYFCDCTDKWSGENCQIPIFCKQLTCPNLLSCVDLPQRGFECVGPATFNVSENVLSYNWLGGNASINSFKFKIRSRSTATTVIELSSRTGRIRSQLDAAGYVLMTFESSELNLTLRSPQMLADGQWHDVIVTTLPNRTIAMSVDDVITSGNVTNLASLIGEILSRDDNRVAIGANDTFKGCLDEIRFGNQLLPFYETSDLSNHSLALSSTLFVITSPSFALKTGCHGDDVCVGLDRCANNGTCVDLFNEFKCDCAPGFTASNCDVNIDDCAEVRCDHGLCVDEINNFTCQCQSGFEGRFCDVEINECVPQPCLNGGLCVNLIGLFFCDCDEANFTGPLCEIDVTHACGDDITDDAPCMNGGKCSNVTSNNTVLYKCECFSPYEGVTCEDEIDFCENATCHNHGSCFSNKTTLDWQCACATGYGGRKCEKEIEPCSNTSCHHNGYCDDTINGFRCTCKEGYLGRRCEHYDVCLRNGSDTFCANDGNCSFDFDNDLNPLFSCECPWTHTGHLCRHDNPCVNTTCLNGGICESIWETVTSEEVTTSSGHESEDVLDIRAVCRCTSEFSGDSCQSSKPPPSSDKNPWIIIGPILGIVVFLVLVAGLASFLCYARGARAQQGTYSPKITETQQGQPLKTLPLPPKTTQERLI
ncbi:protein crumbs-like isoform X2 [Clavelina lepadiformis]|uniref:protein crumbs-like isoform X2 n=1 Tax=Clavelina lepadiformis TaxID=159417 RepID=UPI0040418C30